MCLHITALLGLLLTLATSFQIPYSRKYSQSWWFSPKPSVKNYRQNLNLAVAPRTILCHHKHCSSLYQGALPSSHLKYLNKAISLQIYTKYNRQCTGAELATCTAHVYYINRPALRYIRCDITLCNSLPEQIMNNISPHAI